MDMYEKLAYMKGLIDGADLAATQEGKVISHLIEVLEEVVDAIDDL